MGYVDCGVRDTKAPFLGPSELCVLIYKYGIAAVALEGHGEV